MRDIQTNKFGAKVVYEASQSLINFSNENEQTEFLLFFLHIGGKYISDNKEEARNVLIETYKQDGNESSIKLIDFFKSSKADKVFDTFFYERHFSQLTYVRLVDNFITYFKEILAEVVKKKPQALKSKDQERLDFILDYESMEELLNAIADKKIEELFYKGISDIEKFFHERLGINLFKNDKIKRGISKLIKQRNLIVHNRGKISKEFVREFPESGFEANLYIAFKYKEISELNLYLHNYLVDLDIEIAEKFSLDLIKAH